MIFMPTGAERRRENRRYAAIQGVTNGAQMKHAHKFRVDRHSNRHSRCVANAEGGPTNFGIY